VNLDTASCERALRARDPRFDGRFFIGVVTTGVYCRPVCPVRPPRPKNVRFYPTAAAAEEAGFRPCRRCRPETAPGTPAWRGTSATVARALRLIEDGALDTGGVGSLAGRLGVGPRHLRRLFAEHLGAGPLSVARTRRVHFARRLIDETHLPFSQVADAARFGSVRQFNDAVRSTFGDSPSALRLRAHRGRGPASGPVSLRLPYRPPFDWKRLLAFLAPRALLGVEQVGPDSYRRVLAGGPGDAIAIVSHAPDARALQLELVGEPPADLLGVAEGARRLFDLGADPERVAADLSRDARLAPLVRRAPGLRVPGAWDPFEVAIRAILGQQVSVRGATTLAGRLVARFGPPLRTPRDGLTHYFPSPAALAEADVAKIGLPKARGGAIRAMAAAFESGALPGSLGGDLDASLETLCLLPGIGDWTASYLALRALGHPDAFPAGDLGLRKALADGGELPGASAVAARAEAWRPWRGYAALWLWDSLSKAPETGRKGRKRK
jgi:AraC family transcriptional regulator of adaptative response / DNA-3-methyladenine glycosylase II